jgi:hypothetical protein
MALQRKRPPFPFGPIALTKRLFSNSDVNNYGGIRSTIRSENGSYR